VAVLEALGYEVDLVRGRVCCGRPAASRGLLAEVRRLGEYNLELLKNGTEPIVFLEPSCHSIFIDEYRQLGLSGAEQVAARCVLVEDLVVDSLEDSGSAQFSWSRQPTTIAVHGHCHTKALADPETAARMFAAIPDLTPVALETGCCGMAGAFGMLASKRELSHQVAEPLVEAIRRLPRHPVVAASGTSCRHQIKALTGIDAVHPIEVVAAALGVCTE
jgi:Fe-S oxidoreductase